MDEIWERAVEMALAGQTEPESTRVLTLDGAIKCVKGHLPRPEILERFQNLEHLSIASIGVSSLDQFPRLGNLQKLVLSDNRISGGLEFLVQAGLGLLRDLDLSNNRIHLIDDLVPLAQLQLVSLDLYKCPVTLMKDYRFRVFGLVKSLKYLDKMDGEDNERPESEDEDDDEDDNEEDEDDPGSYEKDGEERPNVMRNGHSQNLEKVVEVDEEESEADEEETETGRQSDGVCDHANGLRDDHFNMDEEENDESDEENGDDEYEPDGFLLDDTQEIEEEDVGEEEEEVDNDEGHLCVPPRNWLQRDVNGEFGGHEEVEEVGRQSDWVSDFVANGARNVPLNVDEEENDDSDEEDGEDEYETDGFLTDDTQEIEEEEVGESEEEVDLGVPNELLRNIIFGEIDGHEQDEDDGESWEEEGEEQGIEDGEEEDEEYGAERLAQSVTEAIQVDEEEEDEDDEVQVVYSIASSNLKRKRDENDDGDSVSSSSDNIDDDGSSDDVSSDDDE